MDDMDDLKRLVGMLLVERYGSDCPQLEQVEACSDEDALFMMFRDLVNTRKPWQASDEFLEIQDRVLRSRIERAGVTDASRLERTPDDERLSIWRGDITALKADAIVNAANSQMLGCWVPGHHCIDNAIHTFSGVQLRIECDRIMQEQGHEEPTGKAKATPAYNLPSTYVIHTVGPIAQGHATRRDKELLAMSYASCLEAAQELGCRSIAFCCISTGVFGFPRFEAANIAVNAVTSWLDQHESDMHVVFNVFSEEDEDIYRELLYT